MTVEVGESTREVGEVAILYAAITSNCRISESEVESATVSPGVDEEVDVQWWLGGFAE